MAEPMRFDLVSPERLLVSEDVESVVVPGSEGYLTVLAQHAPLMTTLRPGFVEVKGLSGETRRIFVRGGFADITPNGLTILADDATPAEDLDAAAMAEEIRLAEEGLSALSADHPHRVVAETRLNQLRDVQRWIIPA